MRGMKHDVRKVGKRVRTLRKEMDESFNNTEETGEAGDLVQEVYVYITEHRYPPSSTEARKRCIRRKASKFAVHDGELYFKKKKKKGKEVSWLAKLCLCGGIILNSAQQGL